MLNSSSFNSIEDYLKFYGLDTARVGYELVPFKSSGFELTGFVFKPDDYKATVVLIHGFMGHTGLMSKFIAELTTAGFAVAAFDLPGHGLSSGERTAIEDFSQYTDSLSDFLNVVRPKLKSPYHLIGFSTGGSTVMDYIFSGKKDYFDKVILAAPLVRCVHWLAAKISFLVYKPLLKDVTRIYRGVSSDKDFERFIRYEDPMSARRVSLKWVDALFKWNKKIADVPICDRKILVIQGKKDNTVAWRYNLKFIQSKFSNAQIKLVEKARHELFNESADLRSKVFSQIREYLEK
ncbi:MAG: alpha/beta hydrolase [Phycisphaerae bacterium]|nr:alpha/beta hydrolase [Phycisphaerae bacterium]